MLHDVLHVGVHVDPEVLGMPVEVCPYSIFLPSHLTAVTIMPGFHGLGCLPCVLGNTEPTGNHIHAESGLAGVMPADGVLPPGLGGQVLGLAILHPQAAHVPAIMELVVACRKDIAWSDIFRVILSESLSHNPSLNSFVLPSDPIDKRESFLHFRISVEY